jgi:hypothetical protein
LHLAERSAAKCLDFAGEGLGRKREFMRYRIEHGVEMFGQFVVSKALHAEVLALKKSGAFFVGEHVFIEPMLAPIQLDDELLFEANKIDDVRSDRLLATELHPRESPIAKCLPKFAFDVGLISTKLSSKIALHLFPLTSKI